MAEKIKLWDVSIGYLNQTIVKDVNLKIEKGEIIGIFGPNGAGKTTLICGINGVARIIKGNVFIDNILLTSFSGPYLRRKIGYVPQIIDIDPFLPILTEDVVFMGLYGKKGLFGKIEKEDKKRFDEIADFFEIKNILKKPFGLLSGGEMRKILIVSAFLKEPEILLLDEVFTFLDLRTTKNLFKKIKEIHEKKNLTILIVAHDIYIIENLCQKVIGMENGKVIFYDEKEKFLKLLKENGNN
ncbi:MAG TPA: ATP-binding cassette domain-containing protein [bacterium]|nr:ATP-binding cassette domain-containing protein [bacterium]HOM26765.1 ATP-binding cassette domain-containing protein [bacterium]